jgi:hypothetical protein
LVQGLCIVLGCSSPVVTPSLRKCLEHLTPAQRQKRIPKPKVIRYSGTPEYVTVQSHKQSIKTAYQTRNAAYANLPFFAAWDPDQGGRLVVGAQWVIENLGRKPSKDYELHIIDRRLGFVPGNLAWVPRSEHKREEMLTKLLIENQHLKDRLAKYESS